MKGVSIPEGEVKKLLAAASGDAALLYLYLQAGGEPGEAEASLRLNHSRFACAEATLRQLGLWLKEEKRFLPGGERPNYSEEDVLSAMEADLDFRRLYGEVQRVLGKALHTEELKILLGFVRYLGLTPELVSVLVSYCKDRQRLRGINRPPTLRAIEKEAYHWAEEGIDTVEEAAAYIYSRNSHNTQMKHIKDLVQIKGRWLTAAEEKYAQQWLDMGFDDHAIRMAFERTCVNTGGMKWPYMNSILQRWHKAGLHTGAAIAAGDKRPEVNDRRDLDADEMAAIAKLMQED